METVALRAGLARTQKTVLLCVRSCCDTKGTVPFVSRELQYEQELVSVRKLVLYGFADVRDE